MRILALDPATVTGWAFWSPDREKPDYGVRLFRPRPGDHPGQRFQEYETFLYEVIEHHNPQVIYYECPLFPGGKTTRHNVTVSFGFEAVLHLVASQDEIRCVPVYPSTLKKWAAGNGRATKADMIQAATRLTGIELRDDQDNEADALCLAVYAAQEEEVTTP